MLLKQNKTTSRVEMTKMTIVTQFQSFYIIHYHYYLQISTNVLSTIRVKMVAHAQTQWVVTTAIAMRATVDGTATKVN